MQLEEQRGAASLPIEVGNIGGDAAAPLPPQPPMADDEALDAAGGFATPAPRECYQLELVNRVTACKADGDFCGLHRFRQELDSDLGNY